MLADLAAAVGALLVLAGGRSVVGTVVVPRRVRSWIPIWVDRFVDMAFRTLGSLISDWRRRDRLLSGQAAAILLGQLVAWLAVFDVGFALLLRPFVPGGFAASFRQASSALSTVGFSAPSGVAATTIDVLAAFFGLATVALQIGYLPALYASFNRRETEVTLLIARAGVPTWGPELLARTHYGLGTGVSTVGTLPEFYARWERWAADVTESHTTYLPLVRFRSPRPLSSWVTALLGVLDSAALYLALSPSAAPTIPARTCLRGGFTCFTQVALAMGIQVPEEADPTSGISLTYEEFLDAVARLRKVDFPIEREPEQAWPDFVGWRVNYETSAYRIASAVSAPAAYWSGPRRIPTPPVAPLRPPDLKAPKAIRRRA